MLTILNGDALEQLKTLPDNSIQCCVTSPPYDDLRTYGGDLEWDFEGIAFELYRVLCPGAVMCWNVGDSVKDGSETLTSFRQAIHFKDRVGFKVHDTMIWNKLNFSNPESARYHQVFEYVFILSKGKPRVFNPIKDKRNTTAGMKSLGLNSYMKRDGEKSTRHKYITEEFGMRGNVWRGKTRGQEEICTSFKHPAMMPYWLARDLILSWSNVGDTIIDPFAGSGTTGAAALETGRNSILIEINPEYCELIKQSCSVTIGMF